MKVKLKKAIVSHEEVIKDVQVLKLKIPVYDERMKVEISDSNGGHIKTYEGTTPDFLPGTSDLVEIEIDINTGQIKNWPTITSEEVEELLSQEEEEASA